jgi:hypothetical protein
MNENNPIPPVIPPGDAAQKLVHQLGETKFPPPPPGERALGDDPAERLPLPHVFAAIEALLRQPRRLLFQLRQPGGGKLIGGMLFVALVCAAVYGVVAGTFSGGP